MDNELESQDYLEKPQRPKEHISRESKGFGDVEKPKRLVLGVPTEEVAPEPEPKPEPKPAPKPKKRAPAPAPAPKPLRKQKAVRPAKPTGETIRGIRRRFP